MRYTTTIRSLVIALAAVGLFGLTGCDSTINKQPEQSVPPDQVFKDVAGARAALNAAYDGMQGTNGACGSPGCVPTVAADVSANTATFTGSFEEYQNMEGYSVNTSNALVQDLWEDHYLTINRANLVIKNAPEVPNISQGTIDNLVGQAKFIRALMYFNLVRWYAQPFEPGAANGQPSVPLVTRAVESSAPNFNVPRSTVDSVYTQIRNDLTDAIDRLGVKTSPKRAGSAAANALLARVSLYQGRYQEAANRAQSVLSQSGIELASNPMTPFQNETSKELIFSVSFSATDTPGLNDFATTFYLAGPLGGRGDINPAPDLIKAADTTNDIRFQVGSYQGSTGLYRNSGALWTNKWTSSANADDVPILRAAEMHLIRAEALAKKSSPDFAGARSHLNQIRTRAGLSKVSSSLSGQALIDEIIRQRRFEFAFEGKRRHTLQRLGRPIRTGLATVQPGDPQRIWPIPERTIKVNDAINKKNQNPGY